MNIKAKAIKIHFIIYRVTLLDALQILISAMASGVKALASGLATYDLGREGQTLRFEATALMTTSLVIGGNCQSSQYWPTPISLATAGITSSSSSSSSWLLSWAASSRCSIFEMVFCSEQLPTLSTLATLSTAAAVLRDDLPRTPLTQHTHTRTHYHHYTWSPHYSTCPLHVIPQTDCYSFL